VEKTCGHFPPCETAGHIRGLCGLHERNEALQDCHAVNQGHFLGTYNPSTSTPTATGFWSTRFYAAAPRSFRCS